MLSGQAARDVFEHPRYKPIAFLGQGAFAVTMLAEDKDLSEQVVVKVAHNPNDVELGRRFIIEAQVLRRVAIPGVPAILDAGVLSDGRAFIVTAPARGVTLEQLLKDQLVLPLPEVLRLGIAVCQVLTDAHAAGFLHRDIKPSNIMVDHRPDGIAVTLLDFGLAGRLDQRRIEDPVRRVTRSGALVGTPTYMSPEQWTGEHHSPQTDLYGLAVVLFRAAVGSLPFTPSDPVSYLGSVFSGHIEWPKHSKIPPRFVALLKQCLSTDAARRPRSAVAMLEELQGILAEQESGDDARAHVTDKDAKELLERPKHDISLLEGATPKVSLGGRQRTLLAFLAAVLVLTGGSTWVISSLVTPSGQWPVFGATGAILVSIGSVIVLRQLRTRLREHRNRLRAQAALRLTDSTDRDWLSTSMAIEIGVLLQSCERFDERILALSTAVLLDESRHATTSDERMKAVMNAVQIIEKLDRLAPWHVRNGKLVATLVSIVTTLIGVAGAVERIHAMRRASESTNQKAIPMQEETKPPK